MSSREVLVRLTIPQAKAVVDLLEEGRSRGSASYLYTESFHRMIERAIDNIQKGINNNIKREKHYN